MSLLVDIAESALDPSYAAAAERRPRPPASRGRVALAVAGVLAATLLIVVAGVQAHRRAPAAARSRAGLLQQVSAATADVGRLQHVLDGLRATASRTRDELLATSAAGSALARRLDAEELAAGAVAVHGPGLRVVLDDAVATGATPGPSTGTTARSDSGNRVLDRDVQTVVNALWAAGAEAVAVDGQRLTAQSAIRQAGSAILVNLSPVAAPYVVTAVGSPDRLETSFATSGAAARMRAYVQLYGLRFSYGRVSSVTLPAAPALALHVARPVPTPSGGAR